MGRAAICALYSLDEWSAAKFEGGLERVQYCVLGGACEESRDAGSPVLGVVCVRLGRGDQEVSHLRQPCEGHVEQSGTVGGFV